MRRIVFYTILFNCGLLLCQPSMSVLRVNELLTRLNSNGLIADSLGSSAIVTRNGLNLLENAGVWMSAQDSSGNIRVAAHSVLNNTHEFWSGPLELLNEKASNQALWDKVYPINKLQIEFHKEHYSDVNYTPSQAIGNWPGSYGYPYAQIMAPFVDYKINDRIYEPMKGDYPYCSSDAMVYSIANDRYSSTHNYSKSLPLGVELHTSVFGFEGDSVLKNCVVVRYSVYNRSLRNYNNFRLSVVLNFGIGGIQNEFLGTEITSKALYAVNDTSEATFSNRMVSLGCMAINRKISSTMYFENTSDPINGQPDSAVHFYRLMQGKWKNGQALNYGSNGVDGSGSARFVYPDTTDLANGGFRWLDQVPGKKIGLLNYDTAVLKAGSAMNYEMVLFYVDKNSYNFKQIGHNCLKINAALSAKNLLNLDENRGQGKPSFAIYPNPAKIGEKLTLQYPFEGTKHIRLIDYQGKQILNLNLDMNENSIILPSDLKSGVYILECETLNTVMTHKLILNL